MLRFLYQLRHSLPRRVEEVLTRGWYEYLSRMDRGANMLFMNYGFADLDADAEPISLHAEDEPNRYCIQLYRHAIDDVDLQGLDVLEVGSGRGGGVSYMARYLRPRSVVGLDVTGSAIRFCSRHYRVPGLSFLQGEAQSLPFKDASFDAVVNIESSHCYPSMERFLYETHRVLRTDGWFFLADHRPTNHVDTLRTQFCRAGFTIRREQGITPNVLRALDLDNGRKQRLIEQNVPRILQGFFSEFAAMQGTRGVYAKFASGDKQYLSFICTRGRELPTGRQVPISST
jgi:ubiquinone/menaquinone biosynthesis C-methylase UbiE